MCCKIIPTNPPGFLKKHYSRTDGRERMISDIEDMMQDATGAERDAYKRAADILRNA